jgi:hypothetical protein
MTHILRSQTHIAVIAPGAKFTQDQQHHLQQKSERVTPEAISSALKVSANPPPRHETRVSNAG